MGSDSFPQLSPLVRIWGNIGPVQREFQNANYVNVTVSFRKEMLPFLELLQKEDMLVDFSCG